MTVSGASSSFSTPSALSTGNSRVYLNAQLNRLKQQLADCVNCESAKTPEGKANIQKITLRVGETEARLNQFSQTDPRADNMHAKSTEAGPGGRTQPLSNIPGADMSPDTKASTIGALVDVFA